MISSTCRRMCSTIPTSNVRIKMFMSPDGKAVRMIITHQGDPASVEGIEHVRDLKNVVADALKGTPLSNAKVSLAGTASLYADMQDGVETDLDDYAHRSR